jgi:hypothetical protein
MRTGYFYPSVTAPPMSNAPSLRTQESGTREDTAGIVDVVPKPLREDFASVPLGFLGVSEENAAARRIIAVKLPETSQSVDLFPEDSLPALACVRSHSDLLYVGLPDDELERVTALALAGFAPVMLAPVAEGEAEKAESNEDTKTSDRSALAVEALVLVVCLCMWPRGGSEDASPVID